MAVDQEQLERIRSSDDRRAAAERVLALQPGWYHTIDLAPGVETPGFCDLRWILPDTLPDDLTGQACLDVGTFDGMYAFAMEERGATDVVAIDVARPEELDHPPLRRESNLEFAERSGVEPGDGFKLAAAARRSEARWVACNVYDLSPEAVGGHKDLAVVSTILQHLRDPVGALERVLHTLRPGGQVVVVETVLPRLSLLHPKRATADFRAARPNNRYTWWVPNQAGLRAWLVAAGFDVAPGRARLHRIPRQAGIGRGDWLGVVRGRRPVAS